MALMLLVISGSCLAAPGVYAGIGSGISGTAVIDTKPPDIIVDPLPEFSLFQGGDIVSFRWQAGDDHPATQVSAYFSIVWAENQIVAATLYSPGIMEWDWTAPEISSANVYLDVVAKDAFGNTAHGYSNLFTVIPSVTDVPADRRRLDLGAPAPNPFNPSTRLDFHLPEAGRVDLVVYDTRGRRIRTLVSGRRDGGEFSVSWDGRDDRGRFQSGGVYLFVLEFSGANHSGRTSRKAVLIP